MTVLNATKPDATKPDATRLSAPKLSPTPPDATLPQAKKNRFEPLKPIRQLLDNIPIDSPKLARFFYRNIPGHCPFERDVILFGRKLAHIPPLCKLNPFYDQLVGLRFRSMCYLVDVCGESL